MDPLNITEEPNMLRITLVACFNLHRSLLFNLRSLSPVRIWQTQAMTEKYLTFVFTSASQLNPPICLPRATAKRYICVMLWACLNMQMCKPKLVGQCRLTRRPMQCLSLLLVQVRAVRCFEADKENVSFDDKDATLTYRGAHFFSKRGPFQKNTFLNRLPLPLKKKTATQGMNFSKKDVCRKQMSLQKVQLLLVNAFVFDLVYDIQVILAKPKAEVSISKKETKPIGSGCATLI